MTSIFPGIQVIIQLRKFAQAANRIKAAVGTEASAPQLAKAVSKGDLKPGDLSDILGTEIRGGMDTSAFGMSCLLAKYKCNLGTSCDWGFFSTMTQANMCLSGAGIIRRVLLIIVVAVFGGTALFFLGLKFAFPEYR